MRTLSTAKTRPRASRGDLPARDRFEPGSSIIVFDGVCVLCSRWVHFVMRHERECAYRFAAMQSAAGRALLIEHGLDPDDPASFLLLDRGCAYTDTEAIARVLSTFGGKWAFVAKLLRIVPRSLLDSIYRWIARHRYRLFGKRDVCLVPSTDLAHRFLS